MKIFKSVPAVFTLVFAAALAACGSSGAHQQSAKTQNPSDRSTQSTSESSTQTFPDGTKVTFVSATWTRLSYNPVDHGVKFTFHIIAGPGWKQNAKVQLRPASGDERPYTYYMVTAAGWAYPDTNSTGYADISNIFTAQGGRESGEGANTLFAGDSLYASSTLYPKSSSPDPQHLVVTIEMPNGKLQSRPFAVNVGPYSPEASPSGESPEASPSGGSAVAPGHDTPEDAVDGLIQAEMSGNWPQACSYLLPSSQSACNQQAPQLSAFTGNATVDGGVVSDSEALVAVTGSICGSTSGCASNSDPSAGMPNGQETFTQAYDQAMNNNNGSLSPVPCMQQNGMWYVNAVH
jgi:hypothetical protein